MQEVCIFGSVSADLSCRPNVNNAAANFLTMVEQEWKSHLGQPQQVNVHLLGFNPSGDPGDPRDDVCLYQGQILTRRANLNHWLGGLYILALRSMSMGTSSHTFRDSPNNPEVK